jgi:hypothetical protein
LHVLAAMTKLAAGKNFAVREALERKINQLRDELAGPIPSPLERILCEWVALAWFDSFEMDRRYVDQYEPLSGPPTTAKLGGTGHTSDSSPRARPWRRFASSGCQRSKSISPVNRSTSPGLPESADRCSVTSSGRLPRRPSGRPRFGSTYHGRIVPDADRPRSRLIRANRVQPLGRDQARGCPREAPLSVGRNRCRVEGDKGTEYWPSNLRPGCFGRPRRSAQRAGS